MAWAICKICGTAQQWFASSGGKLVDQRCRKCGGSLRGTTLAKLKTIPEYEESFKLMAREEAMELGKEG